MPEPRTLGLDLSWHPWPRRIPALGEQGIGPFTKCETCRTGTWAYYGVTPLCRACANRRATLHVVSVNTFAEEPA